MLTELLHSQDHAEATHSESHNSVGEFIKSVIYGGVDGVINTTIIILTGTSSGITTEQIFAICIATIVAGALDMGFCDYVSAKAEMSFAKQEEQREYYEVEHMLQQEKREIVGIYARKGYSQVDSLRLAELYATNRQAFVNIMMLEQLNLVVIKDEAFAMKCGFATFFAFSLFGFVTIIPYLINYAYPLQISLWPFVILIASIELFSLGFTKAMILGISKFKACIQIYIMGIIATGVGFSIGLLFPASQ